MSYEQATIKQAQGGQLRATGARQRAGPAAGVDVPGGDRAVLEPDDRGHPHHPQDRHRGGLPHPALHHHALQRADDRGDLCGSGLLDREEPVGEAAGGAAVVDRLQRERGGDVEVRVQGGRAEQLSGERQGVLVDDGAVHADLGAAVGDQRPQDRPHSDHHLPLLPLAPRLQPLLLLPLQQGPERKRPETRDPVRRTGSPEVHGRQHHRRLRMIRPHHIITQSLIHPTLILFTALSMFCCKSPQKIGKKDVGRPNPKIGRPVADPSHIFKQSGFKEDLIQKFRESFEQQTSQMNDKMARLAQSIETADCLATVQNIPEISCQYWSFNDLFYDRNRQQQQAEQSATITKNLAHPFEALQRSKKAERMLLLCVNDYLQRLKAELSTQPIALREDQMARSALLRLQPILSKKFEDAIQLIRKRQQERISALERQKQPERTAIAQQMPKNAIVAEQRKAASNIIINSSEKQAQSEVTEQNEQPQSQPKQEVQRQEEVKSQNREQNHSQSQSTIERSTRERQYLEQKIAQLQKQNRRLQAQNMEKETVNARINGQLAKLSQSYESLQIEYASLEKERGELLQANNQLVAKADCLQQQKQQLLRAVQLLNERYDKYEGKRLLTQSQLDRKVLFHGKILASRAGEKQFLISSINEHMLGKLSATSLLYTFSRDKKTNFHELIDNHSHLVIVIETERALVAAYYSGVLESTAAMDQEALILSLDRQRVIRLNNARNFPNQPRDPRQTRTIRSMTYDPYYLIFGNAELRVRAGEEKVFSNLGINNSYFNSEGWRAKDLLNESNNEVRLIDYEIYEAEFYEEVQVHQ